MKCNKVYKVVVVVVLFFGVCVIIIIKLKKKNFVFNVVQHNVVYTALTLCDDIRVK